MSRRIGAEAEVARRLHQRRSEVMRPNSIDDDARRQRVRRRDDRLCEFHAAAAIRERLAFGAGDNGEELTRHARPAIPLLATQKNVRIERLVLFRERHRHQRFRFVPLRLAGTAEDAVQRVVIGRRNRVVLVVVTASTADGQGHRPSADDVDAIVDDVVDVVQKPPTKRQESQRRQVRGTFWFRKQIGRELPNQKLVVRHVLVQRADDPVAISERERIIAVLGEDITLRVGVPRHIEPVAPPTFAVLRRGEQAVDHPFVGVGSVVILEFCDVVHRRWQAVQIKGRSANQRAAIGLLCERQLGLIQLLLDEGING